MGGDGGGFQIFGVEGEIGGGGGGGEVGGIEAKEGDFGFEVIDLPLELLLRLPGLLVALLARPGLPALVLLPARLAPHSFSHYSSPSLS